MNRQFALFYAALMIGYVGLVMATGMTGAGAHAAPQPSVVHPAAIHVS